MIVEAVGVRGRSQNSTKQHGQGMERVGAGRVYGKCQGQEAWEWNRSSTFLTCCILAGQIHEGQSWDRDRTLSETGPRLPLPFVVVGA